MKIQSKDKNIVLFDRDFDIIKFLLDQIDTSRKFYEWLQSIVKLRYKTV